MHMTTLSHKEKVYKSVINALEEDIGSGDITAKIIPINKTSKANLIIRNPSILCGIDWFNDSFTHLNKDISILWCKQEGEKLEVNDVVAQINGPTREILTGERTALNFLQIMSGIAYKTSIYKEIINNTSISIMDTRKTIPNLRYEQKYAVKCGGGKNHRIGLFDAVLIKENHIQAAGSIKEAINTFKMNKINSIEVEVQNITELKEAIHFQADIVMLDNFSIDDIKEAIKINNNRVLLEVSGNIDLNKINELITLDIDYISTGDLTKNVDAADYSLLIE